jgi:hypothetical protein
VRCYVIQKVRDERLESDRVSQDRENVQEHDTLRFLEGKQNE